MRKLKLLVFLMLLNLAAMAQTQRVTGTVTDSKTGAPLPAVTIQVKGKTTKTVADINGNFSIILPAGSTALEFSYVGYSPKTVEVTAGTTTLAVSLTVSTDNGLSDVVVTALGISRQAKSLVYATQSIKPGQLTEVRDANNVLNSFQGKIANAVITQGSGGPGSGARIVLRGNRSIQGSNNALLVVDGVPINNDTYSSGTSDFGSRQGSDGASNINPDDIESVTVLRGASAAALYGSQAANGVLVITTKKGSKDRMSVNVNSGVAFEKAFSLPEMQNSYGQGNGGTLDAASGESWGAKMTGQSFTNYLGKTATYSAQPDNTKNFFRTGASFNNSVGISGGTEKAQTYLSYTNNDIQGIIPGNNLLRHTINLRISNQITKSLSVDAKITYINQLIKNMPRTGEENAPVIDLYQVPRNVSIADVKQYQVINNVGVPTPTTWPSTLSSIYQNPYWMVNNSSFNETRDRVIGFLSAKYQITPWLSLTGRANLDRSNNRQEELYYQGTILWATQAGGYYAKNNILATQTWYDAILEGNNNITKDIKINYHAGAIYQDSRFDQNASTANGLNVTNKFSLNFATNPALSSSGTEVQTQAVFAQASVSYKDVLFVDGSFREDWASVLPKPYSFNYPSIGASAIISDMVKLPKAISFLKANLSYAEVGNGGQFGLLSTTYGYSQGAGNGFLSRSSVLPIAGLKPEITHSFEAGFETRFLKNVLGFSLTYYKSNSFNQLLSIALPTATGYSSKYINAGNIQNQGLELVLSATPVKTANFSWDIAANLALNRNKIISLDKDVKTVYLAGGFGRSGTPVVKEGGSYGDLLSYQWLKNAKGQYEVTAAGKPLTSDLTGGEQGLIGNFNPKETIGLTNTVNYKGFSLRLLIDGRIGGIEVSGTEMNLAFSGITKGTEQYREGGWNLGGVDASGAAVNKAISAQDFWQTASGKRYGVGEFFAYDATNFRVRELSIGYNIPVGKKSFIKSARFSAVARNLFWIYRGSSLLSLPGEGKRKMWFDPDMSLGNANYQGVEYGTLPSTRSLGFNLNLTF